MVYNNHILIPGLFVKTLKFNLQMTSGSSRSLVYEMPPKSGLQKQGIGHPPR